MRRIRSDRSIFSVHDSHLIIASIDRVIIYLHNLLFSYKLIIF